MTTHHDTHDQETTMSTAAFGTDYALHAFEDDRENSAVLRWRGLAVAEVIVYDDNDDDEIDAANAAIDKVQDELVARACRGAAAPKTFAEAVAATRDVVDNLGDLGADVYVIGHDFITRLIVREWHIDVDQGDGYAYPNDVWLTDEGNVVFRVARINAQDVAKYAAILNEIAEGQK